MSNDDEQQRDGEFIMIPVQSGMPSSSENPEAVFERAADLKRHIDTAYIDLGRTLYMIFHRRLYLKRGHSTFDEYLDKDLIISRSRADRCRRIWTRFVKEIGLSPEQLRGIGYTRALKLLPVISNKNVMAWLDKARDLPWNQLETEVAVAKQPEPEVIAALVAGGAEVVKTEIGPASAPKVEIVSNPRTEVKFNLYDHQKNVLQAALDEVKRSKATEVAPNEALAHVATEFLASRMTKEEKPHAQVNFYLSSFEHVFGGKFFWVKSAEAAQVLLDAVAGRDDVVVDSTTEMNEELIDG